MKKLSQAFEQGVAMHIHFLGKDPESDDDGSPTLFATDRTDRKTYLIRGWHVTDPQALAEAGENPPGEGLLEIPADLFRFIEQGDR